MRHIKLLKPALVLMIVGATLASCGEKKLKDSYLKGHENDKNYELIKKC